MRIALIHRRYSRAGGVEKNVVLLTEGLAARGHEVTVVCGHADTDVPAAVTIQHIETTGATQAGRYWSFADRCAHWLATQSFDIAQGFDLTYEQDVLRLGRGVMKVYRDVLASTRSGLDRWWRSISPSARRLLELEQRMVDGSHTIVTNSRTTRTELQQAYGVPAARIETILNGIDLSRFTVEAARAGRTATRDQFGIPKNARCVLYVGTGFRRKGLDTLIQALPKDAHLLVIGRDGAMRRYKSLAARHQANVVFAGAQPVTPALYGAADVLALPSRYEPFSNVVLEALASGIPAIHPRCGGAAEALERGLEALVLDDADDAAALGDILERTLAAPPSAQVCRGVAEQFPDVQCITQYEALYERLIEARS